MLVGALLYCLKTLTMYNLLLFVLVFSYTFGTQKMQKDRHTLMYKVVGLKLQNQRDSCTLFSPPYINLNTGSLIFF